MSNVKIRIDTKNYRINIHRHALKAIGDPPFLNFGYDRDSMLLRVDGNWVNDGKTVRVRVDNSGSVYVYSKSLLVGIQEVSSILTAPGSYLAEGVVMEHEKAIFFSLRSAQLLNEKSP